jgi:formiminoglutamate deiminase
MHEEPQVTTGASPGTAATRTRSRGAGATPGTAAPGTGTTTAPAAPGDRPAVTYWTEYAWLGTHVEPAVAIDTHDGRIQAVHRGVSAPPPGAEVLSGLTLPGLANTHSHAFHRALRGTVQVGTGTFWTWREIMYSVADRLTPDTYHRLARAVYAEMALAGITAVGEFHYLHHAPGGAPYADPNAMGEAVIAAAAEAGIRITLLDAAYLSSGFGAPPDRHQRRFSDGSAEAWAERVSLLKDREHARIGAAVHSVRAVPAAQLGTVADWAGARGAPLHVHVSEQTAENDACRAAHGCTPARLLADHGVLGPRTTGIHHTHLTPEDIRLIGASRTGTCMCPTTERDLADGIGPAAALQRAGSTLSLGTDSHAVIDLFEEARGMELNERLRTRRRGHWTAAALLRAATADGHAALGWPDCGIIEPGGRADFVTVALDSVRTAGPRPPSSRAPRPTSGTPWWPAVMSYATGRTRWSRTPARRCPPPSKP